MLSPMAKEDIAYLQGLGVKLEPEQIVRLNTLATRVERGSESAGFAHAPRVAWAGTTPLFEPSIAAEVWLQDFAYVWWHGNSATLATAWASANSLHGASFFLAQTNEACVRREIEAWQAGLGCTLPQLLVALDYACTGAEQRDESDAARPAAPIKDGCPYQDLIEEAVAANLGATLEEMKSLPRRVVSDMLTRWLKNQVAMAGGKPSSVSARAASSDYKVYDDYMNELEALAPQEQEAGDVEG